LESEDGAKSQGIGENDKNEQNKKKSPFANILSGCLLVKNLGIASVEALFNREI
jgi:hypothetical protein